MNKERREQLETIIKNSDLCRHATRHLMSKGFKTDWRYQVNKAVKELLGELEKPCDCMIKYGR